MILRRLLSLLLLASFSLSLAVPVLAQDDEAAAEEEAKKKKKKKKKADVYENNKYRSFKVLADDNRTYKFDADGNPILSEEDKKKLKKKAKKKKKADDEEGSEAAPACAETETCEEETEGKKKPKVSSEGTDF
jgi:hypothetical protein